MTRGRASLFTILFVFTARTAAADPSAADRVTARTLAQEGQQALESKHYGVAVDKFSRADALVHAPTLLLGLARAQIGLGKLVEAQENLNRIVREGVAAGAPHPWIKAVDDAAKDVTAIAPRIPWVTITVFGPTSPEVVIDSTPVPPASLGAKRAINPGPHKIMAAAEGFQPTQKEVVLSEGQALTINLELEQLPAEPLPLARKSPNQASDQGSSEPTDTRKILGFSALGLGGAGLIVGGVSGLLALGKHAKLKDACPNAGCDPREQATLDSFHTFGAISTGGFIVGGVGVTLGAVLLLARPSEATQARVARVSPFVGWGSAGLRGTF